MQDTGNGLFTHFILKGLKGGADENKNKEVTVLEMNPYLTKNVKEISEKVFKKIQEPSDLAIFLIFLAEGTSYVYLRLNPALASRYLEGYERVIAENQEFLRQSPKKKGFTIFFYGESLVLTDFVSF